MKSSISSHILQVFEGNDTGRDLVPYVMEMFGQFLFDYQNINFFSNVVNEQQ